MKKFFLFLLFLFLSKDFIANNNLKQILRDYCNKYSPFQDKENNIPSIGNNKFVALSYMLSLAGCIYAVKTKK